MSFNRKTAFLVFLLFVYGCKTAIAQSVVQEEQDINFAKRLFDRGMFDLAASQYLRFAEDYPTSPRAPEALLQGGQSFLKIDSLIKASQTFYKLFFRYPQSALLDQAQFSQGTVLAKLGEHLDAALIFERIRLFSPQSELIPAAQLKAGECFLLAGQPTRAIDAVRFLQAQYPTHPLRLHSFYLAAQIRMQQHRFQDAMSELERLRGENLQDDLAVNSSLLRARIFERIGRFSKADSVLTNTLQGTVANDSLTAAAMRLSRSLQSQGKYDSSNQIIDALLKKSLSAPAIARAQTIRVDNFYLLGNFAQAKRALDLIKSEHLTDFERIKLVFRRGMLALKMGDYQNAGELFRAVVEANDSSNMKPLQEWALSYWADALVADRMPYDAVERLQYYLHQSSANQTDLLLYKIAVIFERELRDYISARKHYSTLVALYPKSILADDSQVAIARCHEMESDFQVALDEYRVAIRNYPGAEADSTVLQRIRFLEKFTPVSGSKVYPVINDLIVRSLIGDSTDESLRLLIRQQTSVFRDYTQAIQIFRHIAQRDSSVLTRGELLRDLSLCYARLTELATVNGQPDQVEAHLKQIEKISDLALRSPVDSMTGVWVRIHSAEARLSQAKNRDRIALLTGLLAEIPQVADFDSARQQIAGYLFDELGKVSPGDTVLTGHVLRWGQRFSQSMHPPKLRAEAFYLLGELYHSSARLDSAEICFRNAIELAPQGRHIVDAKYALATLYQKQKDHEKALFLFRDIIARYGYSKLADRSKDRLVETLLAQNRADQILQLVPQPALSPLLDDLKVYQSTSLTPRNFWYRAMAHRQMGQYPLASTALHSFYRHTDEAAWRAKALYQLAEIAADRGDKDAAFGYYSEILATAPADTLAQLARVRAADYYFERGQYEDAKRAYQLLKNTTRDELLQRIDAHEIICEYRLGNLTRANSLAEAFKKSSPQKSYEAKFLYEEGNLQITLKNFKEAERILKDLSNKYKDQPEAGQGELGLARLYVVLNRTDDALKILTRIPEKYSDPEVVAGAYLYLADFYYVNRQLDNCIAAGTRVLDVMKKGPMRARALDLLINSYDDFGLKDRAIALLRNYLEEYPDSPEYLQKKIKMGVFLRDLKEYDRSIALLQEVKPQVDAETEPEVQYWIAKAFADRGDTEQAIVEFLKVKYLGKPTKLPWGDTALYEAAQAYRKLGNLGQARELFNQIVRERGSADQIGRVASEKMKEIDEELARKS